MNQNLIGAECDTDSDEDVPFQNEDFGNVQVLETALKGKWYFRGDGYYFHKKYIRNGILWLKCIRKGCKALAKTPSNLQGQLVPKGRAHIHPASKKKRYLEQLKKEILKNSEKGKASLCKIYSTTANRYHSKITAHRPYTSSIKGQQKRRAKNRPKIPNSILQLHAALLNTDYVKTIDGPNFITAANEQNLILISPIASELFSQNVIFCCDGTFKCTPKKPKIFQLFVIGGICNNAFIPIIYALMQKKDKANYEWVLRTILERFPQWNPQYFISDFETGSMSAISAVFPNCHQQGCWFHYSQGVEKRAKTLGLTQIIKENPLAKKIVKRLMVLPLLPDQFIGIGWEMTNLLIEANFPENEQLKNLSSYVKTYWIDTMGPGKISVANADHRTNNLQEAFNGMIMLHMGDTRTGAHPNVWNFFDALITIEHDMAGKYRAAKKGRRVNFLRPKKWRRQFRQIATAQERLQGGEYTIDQFLNHSAHFRNFNLINDIIDIIIIGGDDANPDDPEPLFDVGNDEEEGEDEDGEDEEDEDDDAEEINED